MTERKRGKKALIKFSRFFALDHKTVNNQATGSTNASCRIRKAPRQKREAINKYFRPSSDKAFKKNKYSKLLKP